MKLCAKFLFFLFFIYIHIVVVGALFTPAVMILNFRTDRCGHTVQTQIRLLWPKSYCLIRVFTVCYSICIFSRYHAMVEPLSLNFRLFTVKLMGVRNLGTLQYLHQNKDL